MAERGLVERADCPTDLRGTWVVLTAAGADAFATASCGYVETLDRVFFSRLDGGAEDRAPRRRRRGARRRARTGRTGFADPLMRG